VPTRHTRQNKSCVSKSNHRGTHNVQRTKGGSPKLPYSNR